MLNETDTKVMQEVCWSVCKTEARRWTGGRNLLEDCVQEVLLKVLKGITNRTLSGAEVPRYTRTTAYYEAHEFFQKYFIRKNHLPTQSFDAGVEPQDVSDNNPVFQAEQREETDRLQAAFQRLPLVQREVLEVVAMAGKHNKAVENLAKRWGCKRNKIYYLRTLAIKAIQEHLRLKPEEGSHAN